VKRCHSLVTGLGYAFGGDQWLQRRLADVVRLLSRVAFACNQRVFVQNPDDAEMFLERRLLSREKLTTVNGSGVDLKEFDVVPLPPGPTVFLLIARLLVEKGVLVFVEAARKLKRRYPDARFRLLGPFDSNPSSLKPEQIDTWVDEGIIDYLGETKDVRPFIADAHVFVLPSFYREGTPRSILEAMSMGRPIITTDAPGCRETVINGENGFLIPIKDSDKLADAMETFIRMPLQLIKASKNSRVLAEEKFDVHKVNQVMLRSMALLQNQSDRKDEAA